MDSEPELDDSYTDPYDVQANEPRPDSVVYTQIFRDLQAHFTKAAALLRDPLDNSKFKNHIILGLLMDIDVRTKHAQSEHVVFAVAGDMCAGKLLQGVDTSSLANGLAGKSSVINSVLGMGTIARKVRFA